MRALKGEIPFGSDLPDPPEGATIRRMPAGFRPLRCPRSHRGHRAMDRRRMPGRISGGTTGLAADQRAGGQLTHRRHLVHRPKPRLGGQTATGRSCTPRTASRRGRNSFTTRTRLCTCGASGSARNLAARSEGPRRAGDCWRPPTAAPLGHRCGTCPSLAPSFVCGLSVVNESVIYASGGTNDPGFPTRVMRTTDGGASSPAQDMSEHATLLVDIYFTDAENGWVVGGKGALPQPPKPPDPRSHIKPVVLRTTDGGQTWTNAVASLTRSFRWANGVGRSTFSTTGWGSFRSRILFRPPSSRPLTAGKPGPRIKRQRPSGQRQP